MVELKLSNLNMSLRKQKILDIVYLFVFAIFVYGIILTTNRIIPNADHTTHYRWLSQFYASIESGIWYPRWMPMAQLGLGEAHYSAYPLYYYLSSFFVWTGLSAWTTIKFMALLSTFLGAVIIYSQLYQQLGRRPALLAACFWQLAPFPFFLFTNFGALPWHFSLFLALQFIFISLLPVRRFGRLQIILVAMALTFAHVLVAFMIFVCIGFTKFFIVYNKETRFQLLKLWFLPTSIGVLLTAFHFIPTISILSLLYTNPESARIFTNWQNGFIFPTFSYILWGGKWFSLQWIYPGLALFSAITSMLVLWRYKNTKDDLWKLLLSLTVFMIVGLVLGSEIAFPLYFFNTPFRSLQFSCRFVTIGALGAALVLPIAIHICRKAHEQKFLLKAGPIVAVMVTLIIFGALQVQLLREGRDPQLTATRLTGEFHQEGNQFATTGPKWREYVRSGGLNALCIHAHIICIEGNSNSQYHVWEIKTDQPTNLIFPLFSFPAWSVRLDGKKVTSMIDHDTGLISVLIPSGTRKVEIELGEMPQSRTGVIVSLIGLLGLLLLVILDFLTEKKSKMDLPAKKIHA